MRRFSAPLLTAVMLIVPFLAACGGSSSPSSPSAATAPAPGGGDGAGAGLGASPSVSAPGAPGAPGGEPGIVAVTTAGALVRLDPATGSVAQTLVPGGVLGDEVSVSSDGSTAYFAEGAGCHTEVESVSTNGGELTAIAPGLYPAISPDGSKLAFADEPLMTKEACLPTSGNLASHFKLVVRAVSSGSEQVLPLPPQVGRGGLFSPISHLSWAPDSTRLAVSVSAVQDNEGWNVYIVDTSVAKYYELPGAGVTFVPVTGSPAPQRSYLREGVFLPDGNLFISRACCGGFPVHNTSRLMWEVSTAGALVHQVAIGFADLEHTSLAADSSGQWLLYLAGNDLYVSQGGNRPDKLTTGLIAAAWR
ncbi:MAG TPA: hypothetical protein VFQ44_18455 [Streptosporangiaceae bacterium]|nr:hypothetical protein [Streptosporangiaceae bacterium]